MQGWVVFATAYNIGLGIFHLLFWRLFGWPDSLRPSGQVNMAITQTLNLMLSYGFFALAIGLIWATAWMDRRYRDLPWRGAASG